MSPPPPNPRFHPQHHIKVGMVAHACNLQCNGRGGGPGVESLANIQKDVGSIPSTKPKGCGKHRSLLTLLLLWVSALCGPQSGMAENTPGGPETQQVLPQPRCAQELCPSQNAFCLALPWFTINGPEAPGTWWDRLQCQATLSCVLMGTHVPRESDSQLPWPAHDAKRSTSRLPCICLPPRCRARLASSRQNVYGKEGKMRR